MVCGGLCERLENLWRGGIGIRGRAGGVESPGPFCEKSMCICQVQLFCLLAALTDSRGSYVLSWSHYSAIKLTHFDITAAM